VTPRPTTSVRVQAWTDASLRDRPDKIVTEEPMEIRIHAPGEDAKPLAVIMRTPGNDFELAVGFCLTEGIIEGAANLAEVRYCMGPDAEQEYNVVTVATRGAVDLDGRERAFVSGASCGICGKTTLDQLEVMCAPLGVGPRVALTTLVELPDRLRTGQTVFDATGGLHAAGLFSAAGDLQLVREDVGRHNAVDKLIGHAVLAGQLPLGDVVLVVSGRVSFEIVQKAARAGITVLVAVSAPSSLAVATAQRLGMTLVGFVRDGRANVYSGAARVEAA
jgi:formate dehydrogenase family accessory protein FdhD